jgi:hypothetical protein
MVTAKIPSTQTLVPLAKDSELPKDEMIKIVSSTFDKHVNTKMEEAATEVFLNSKKKTSQFPIIEFKNKNNPIVRTTVLHSECFQLAKFVQQISDQNFNHMFNAKAISVPNSSCSVSVSVSEDFEPGIQNNYLNANQVFETN